MQTTTRRLGCVAAALALILASPLHAIKGSEQLARVTVTISADILEVTAQGTPGAAVEVLVTTDDGRDALSCAVHIPASGHLYLALAQAFPNDAEVSVRVAGRLLGVAGDRAGRVERRKPSEERGDNRASRRGAKMWAHLPIR